MEKKNKKTVFGILKSLQIFIIVPILIFVYFLTLGINLPYVGPNATNFNNYSLIARNYNKFGLLNTKFAQITSVSRTLPDNPQYYLHHPPLISIIQALFFKILGESFMTGRLPVIIFSILSLVFIYFIGKEIKNKKFALVAVIIYCFIPASSIFGRMIGQEPLVLFFSLASIYLLLKYLKSKSKLMLLLFFISIVLGTLSDWPMIYFSFWTSWFLIFKKEYKLAVACFAASLLTGIAFLLNIYYLVHGFSDIIAAFLTRSPGQLLNLPFWPIIWPLVIFIRLNVYFTPLFTLFSLVFLKGFRETNRQNNNTVPIIFVMLFFGLTHIALFPEGSFGHPYWIYYLIPFIVFYSTFTLFKLFSSKKILLAVGLAVNFYFFIRVENWKIKEIQANLWRYDIAKTIEDKYLAPYETISINSNSLVDPDMFAYQFNHDVLILNPKDIIKKETNTDHYIYSCFGECLKDKNLIELLENKKYVKEKFSQGDVYTIFLKEKRKNPGSENLYLSDSRNSLNIVSGKESLFKKIYNYLLTFLHMPQL